MPRTVRGWLYFVARTMGDIQAVSKGQVKRRVRRRVAGRILGKLLRKL
jgi:hypothetical protein